MREAAIVLLRMARELKRQLLERPRADPPRHGVHDGLEIEWRRG